MVWSVHLWAMVESFQLSAVCVKYPSFFVIWIARAFIGVASLSLEISAVFSCFQGYATRNDSYSVGDCEPCEAK